MIKKTFRPGSRGISVRNCLVVFQFASSIALIAGTLIVSDQVNFMLNKDPGFNKEQVMVISNGNSLGESFSTFKEELKKNPAVISVAGSGQYPTQATHSAGLAVLGSGTTVQMYNTGIGYDFIETLDLELIRGNSFTRGMASDSNGVILNETAVNILGLAEPVGTLLGTFRTSIVVGVVKNYNFRSLHHDIGPLILFNSRDRSAAFISVRIKSEDINSTVSYINSVWDDFTGSVAFDYSFMEEDIERWYNAETKTGQISAIFSILAISIGCLGLFGLAAFISEQRTKEIGVRKVIGASTGNIIYLLARDFMKLIMISVLIAIPITYFIMNNWLDNFAFRTDISYFTFMVAGGLTLLIAMLTVSFQVTKAANYNPADTLKYE
ncbi:ABC transporter permease [candidate division KSB1 bacterium]